MSTIAEEEDTPEARLADARKAAQYSYLLPAASAQMMDKMRAGEGAVEEDTEEDTEETPDDEAPGEETPAEEVAAENTAAAQSATTATGEQPDADSGVAWEPIDEAAARDKAIGCFLGLAVGDALGGAVEFAARGSFPLVTDMTGGGPFQLAVGEWTDDTTMALCLAESLLKDPDLDLADLMTRFRAWLEKGENTVRGACFDIGATTRAAIQSFIADGDPNAGIDGPRSAGNGSLVRLAPVAILRRSSIDEATSMAQKQSRATHAAQESLDACSLFIAQLIDALAGGNKEAVMRQRVMALTPRLLFISAGEWKKKSRDGIRSSGYVVRTLEAALWSVWKTDNYRDAVLTAVNLGDDADSVGAVAGQLAGALYGAKSIPQDWLAKLAWREKIENLAGALFDRGR
jgi:ADP-ribosyl-[dinitrogen reductase] hydrolase